VYILGFATGTLVLSDGRYPFLLLHHCVPAAALNADSLAAAQMSTALQSKPMEEEEDYDA